MCVFFFLLADAAVPMNPAATYELSSNDDFDVAVVEGDTESTDSPHDLRMHVTRELNCKCLKYERNLFCYFFFFLRSVFVSFFS